MLVKENLLVSVVVSVVSVDGSCVAAILEN